MKLANASKKSKDCKIIGSSTKETEKCSEDGETLKGREDNSSGEESVFR